MSSVVSSPDSLLPLAEQYRARLRDGDRPSITEYATAHPHHAERIRAEFPLIAANVVDNRTPPMSEPPPAVSSPLGVPLQLGDFRIEREIGRGGMGVVYEAVQESLGRHVALKVLPHQFASGAYLERFRQEARSAAKLHHSNIVPVFGVGEHAGTHYYAMQFIHGQGLDVVLKEARRARNIAGDDSSAGDANTVAIGAGESVPREELLNAHFELADDVIMEAPVVPGLPTGGPGLATAQGADYFLCAARTCWQVAEGLAYAHHLGVVHRDIKPSNILLDIHGTAWITDFGLAKADESQNLTNRNDILGTLRYMAPERFHGLSDASGDVYALGMTLYELLALRPAFEETDKLQLIERITKSEPPPLRSLVPTVPLDLETIVLKAIHREREGRYSSAQALAEDLNRFLLDRPVLARRLSKFELGVRWCRRNPAVAGLLGVVAGLLLVMLAGAARTATVLRGERDQARLARDRAKEAELQATDRLWGSYLAQARAARLGRQVGQRFDSLNALYEAARIRTAPELRVQAAACLALPDLRAASRWEGWPAGSQYAAFDAALERCARTDLRGALKVVRVADGLELLKVDGDGSPAIPLLSDDGQALALWRELSGRLTVWSLAGVTPVQVLNVPTGVGRAWAYSADGRSLLAAHNDGFLFRHDLTTGKATRLFELPARPQCLAVHPAGDRLALAVGAGVKVVDAVSGQAQGAWELPGLVGQVAWHPEGKRAAATCEDGRVYLGEPLTGKRLFALEGHRGAGVRLAFDPAGDLLASAGPEGTLRLWNPHTGRQLLRAPGQMPTLRFGLGGRQLSAEARDGILHLWEVQPGREYRTLVSNSAGPGADYGDGAISPDGRVLAVAMTDGVRLWDVSTGQELAFLPVGPTAGVLFRTSRELVTSGADGIWRWPVTTQAATDRWTLGPPERLADFPCGRLSQSLDGSVIATAVRPSSNVNEPAAFRRGGAVVLDLAHPCRRPRLLPHPYCGYVGVSADGQYVATGAEGGGEGVRVFQADSGVLLKQLPVVGPSTARFSPDNRWLAVGGRDSGHLFQVGSWSDGPRFDAGPTARLAFTHDGRLLATETGTGAVRVVDPETGWEVARLEDPNQDRAGWVSFSPDSGRLFTTTVDSDCIHLWDVRALREQLAARKLDWELPALPTLAPEVVPPVTKVAVAGTALMSPSWRAVWEAATGTWAASRQPTDPETFHRRAMAWLHLKHPALAEADLSRCLQLDPAHAEARYRRGVLRQAREAWADALADYNVAVKVPALADAVRQGRAKALIELNRAGEALSDLDSALGGYEAIDAELCKLHATANIRLGRFPEAMADLDRGLTAAADHAGCLNNLAWLLLTGPENLRDPVRALELARRAVQIAPERSTHQNTLGVAHLRLGQFAEAREHLEKSLIAGAGKHDGYNLYFLAICARHLGDRQEAVGCWLRAEEWLRGRTFTPYDRDEIRQIRAEAAGAADIAPGT